MPTIIQIDDSLIDAIQEFRTSGRSLASEPGLLDRVFSAVYHGIDVERETDAERRAIAATRAHSNRCYTCGHSTSHYEGCANAIVAPDDKCVACVLRDDRYEHTCGIW